MQLPEELQAAIDRLATHSPALRKAREALTQNYREGGASRFGDEAFRLAYLGARMPATYAAVYQALKQALKQALENAPPCRHLLDLGAGPGTASWAATSLFPDLQKITLIEQNPEAIALGKELAKSSSHPALREAEWIQQSLVSVPIPRADGVILSYVLNELADPSALVQRCWEALPLLILIEPGTPKGFQLIRKIREQLLSQKAHLIAPCPHAFACPMQGSDWCHFSARVERTRLHRLLKEGSLGYEDEKFSYLIASKHPGASFTGRIVRPPVKQSGFVRLSLCTKAGRLEEKTITRKDKESYRIARHAEWGDLSN